MKLDEKDWRPITFEGETFPPSFMAIDVLEPILEFEDEDLGSWLFRLCVCKGVTKSAPAKRCAKNSSKAIDLLIQNEERVKTGIKDRLSSHNFKEDEAFQDWLTSLRLIQDISKKKWRKCQWSAPIHETDSYKTKEDVERLLKGLEKAHQSGAKS